METGPPPLETAAGGPSLSEACGYRTSTSRYWDKWVDVRQKLAEALQPIG